MRPTIRRGLAWTLSLIFLSGISLVSANGASAATVNPQTDRIFVLNNNIENRAHSSANCDFDFSALLNKSKDLSYYPDIFTVQQVSNQADLNDLIRTLKTAWGVDYAGAIAVPNPLPENNMYPGVTTACKGQKNFQTNAVLWRSDRFAKLGQTNWLSDGKVKNAGGCVNLADTYPKQMRTKNVAVALQDKIAKRTVVAASVHWALQPDSSDLASTFNAHACASENMREANEKVEALATSYRYANYSSAPKPAKIVAGDMNAKTSINGWWDWAKGTGYIDPIANICGQTLGSHDTKASCLAHKTTPTGVNRIDYILIKDGTTTAAGALTIAQPSGKPYSGHMAIRATVKY